MLQGPDDIDRILRARRHKDVKYTLKTEVLIYRCSYSDCTWSAILALARVLIYQQKKMWFRRDSNRGPLTRESTTDITDRPAEISLIDFNYGSEVECVLANLHIVNSSCNNMICYKSWDVSWSSMLVSASHTGDPGLRLTRVTLFFFGEGSARVMVLKQHSEYSPMYAWYAL